MTALGWLQIALYFGLILALTKPLGNYMFRVFEGAPHTQFRWLGPIERVLHRLCGVDPAARHSVMQYGTALLIFSAVGQLLAYLILRAQAVLPLNPQGMGAIAPDLAFNTAASFTTNTNWQAYGGESTMSYAAQALALNWHNFASAAVGFCVALAVARGLTRNASDRDATIGNFWVDLIRAHVYVLLPLSIGLALLLASQGVVQTLSGYVAVTTLDGGTQTLPMGQVASQEAIKMLGINGGGIFNANSAHPFENPTPFTNLVEMLAIFLIPAGLTHTYGLMARDTKQGWAMFSAMSVLFLAGAAVSYFAESAGNPLVLGSGNMEGKEVRFGIAGSTLFATATTAASCGAVNSMHDSYTALGGLVQLVNMQLGEVIFGGIGVGLTGLLVFAILSVFIAGLMVGRTPEYLGKKVEQREMKLAMLYVLVFPLSLLGFSAWAAVAEYGVSSLNNAGPHGLSEILYAYSSGTGNNGSAFAGLNANTLFYNTTLGIAMLVGRFLTIVPLLAIAGSMLGKSKVPLGPGTFPTHGTLFVALLVAVVIIVGALTFLPALSLGPIVEHFMAGTSRTF